MEVEETEHIMKETPEVMDVMVIRTVLNLMSGYFIYNMVLLHHVIYVFHELTRQSLDENLHG